MQKMTIYISGRITGYDDYEKTFKEAKEMLLDDYPEAEIINPAEVVLPEICGWSDYMAICLRLLDKATHIYMLDNWVQSKGACMEHLYALENDIKVLWPESSPYR